MGATRHTFVSLHDDPDARPDAFVDELWNGWLAQFMPIKPWDALKQGVVYRAVEAGMPFLFTSCFLFGLVCMRKLGICSCVAGVLLSSLSWAMASLSPVPSQARDSDLPIW